MVSGSTQCTRVPSSCSHFKSTNISSDLRVDRGPPYIHTGRDGMRKSKAVRNAKEIKFHVRGLTGRRAMYFSPLILSEENFQECATGERRAVVTGGANLRDFLEKIRTKSKGKIRNAGPLIVTAIVPSNAPRST
ncbi:unnamed protein product [Thelazia callipaeda]|uniref:Uncharacterized protein n=1 Tax=Thelazia callipaeda TaxID=103827 RepID=A0A0N5CKZ8_THECL|nr:unnamed protein product [Thelazia callipaeda]